MRTDIKKLWTTLSKTVDMTVASFILALFIIGVMFIAPLYLIYIILGFTWDCFMEKDCVKDKGFY